MQVLVRVARGATIGEACKDTEISEAQFREAIAKGGETLKQFQHDVAEAERIRLVEIASAQARILEQLVQAATMSVYSEHITIDGETRTVIVQREVAPADQLKILKYLDGIRKELENKHGLHTETDKAGEYLSGPNTQIEKSQIEGEHEMSRSSVNVRPRNDGSVDVTFKEFIRPIDAAPTDPDNLEANSS